MIDPGTDKTRLLNLKPESGDHKTDIVAPQSNDVNDFNDLEAISKWDMDDEK